MHFQICSTWFVIPPHAEVSVYASLPSPFRMGERKLAKLESLGFIQQFGSIVFERSKVW